MRDSMKNERKGMEKILFNKHLLGTSPSGWCFLTLPSRCKTSQ